MLSESVEAETWRVLSLLTWVSSDTRVDFIVLDAFCTRSCVSLAFCSLHLLSLYFTLSLTISRVFLLVKCRMTGMLAALSSTCTVGSHLDDLLVNKLARHIFCWSTLLPANKWPLTTTAFSISMFTKSVGRHKKRRLTVHKNRLREKLRRLTKIFQSDLSDLSADKSASVNNERYSASTQRTVGIETHSQFLVIRRIVWDSLDMLRVKKMLIESRILWQ